jgi:hypothetical protein
MNEKLKIVIETCAYVLAIFVLLYLFLKVLKESKTFRLVVSIFAWVVLIGSTIIYTEKILKHLGYLGNN